MEENILFAACDKCSILEMPLNTVVVCLCLFRFVLFCLFFSHIALFVYQHDFIQFIWKTPDILSKIRLANLTVLGTHEPFFRTQNRKKKKQINSPFDGEQCTQCHNRIVRFRHHFSPQI